MPNIALLREVIEQIEKTPNLWDQSSWYNLDNECGTSYCVAGWVAVKRGHEPPQINLYEDDDDIWEIEKSPGEYVHVSEWSEYELGLSEDQADWLFSGNRTLEEIKATADHLEKNPNATYTDFRMYCHRLVLAADEIVNIEIF